MTIPPRKTKLKIVLGTMTIGKPGVEKTRIHDLEAAAALLDTYQRHGHNEVDTARTYGLGSSEEYLGQLGWQKRGLLMDTKYYPTVGRNMPGPKSTHNPHDLRHHLLASLAALNCDKVDMWYLHAPDHTTPYEDTLREVNNLYNQGYFTRFALSNYQAWEVAQISEICIRNGWVRPVVYQGVYNAVHRSVEPELFPCLRKYQMAFYAYNPLAGGYLTHRYHRHLADQSIELGSRFDLHTRQGELYRARYWHDVMFDALEILRSVAKQHQLTESECALRWLMHHSSLQYEYSDSILVGASSVEQLEQNLVDLEKGPLPKEVVLALDRGWDIAKRVAGRYWE